MCTFSCCNTSQLVVDDGLNMTMLRPSRTSAAECMPLAGRCVLCSLLSERAKALTSLLSCAWRCSHHKIPCAEWAALELTAIGIQAPSA